MAAQPPTARRPAHDQPDTVARASGPSATSSRSRPTSGSRRTTTGSTSGPGSRTSTPGPASPRSTRPTCAAGCAGGASTPSAGPASTAARPPCSSRTSWTTSTSCSGSGSTAAGSRPSSCGSSRGVSTEFGRDTADVTDRQNMQLHWIRIEDVPEIWRRLEAVGLSTTEACGDTPRVILGSPVAGIAADELLDGSPAIDAIQERFIGSPEFSNLPRKFKTAISGSPLQDVEHEVNDISFVGVVHPEHGPGFDLWVGGGLSTNPMLAQRLGAWVPLDGGARRLGRRRRAVPRLRLPAAAHPGPDQVPGRRLGRREVPPGARGRVPRPGADRRAGSPGAVRLARPHRRAPAEGRPLLRRPRADGRPGLRHGARPAGRHRRGARLAPGADHAAPEAGRPRRARRPGRLAGRRRCRARAARQAGHLPAQHDGLHRHRVLQAGDRRDQGPRAPS